MLQRWLPLQCFFMDIGYFVGLHVSTFRTIFLKPCRAMVLSQEPFLSVVLRLTIMWCDVHHEVCQFSFVYVHQTRCNKNFKSCAGIESSWWCCGELFEECSDYTLLCQTDTLFYPLSFLVLLVWCDHTFFGIFQSALAAAVNVALTVLHQFQLCNSCNQEPHKASRRAQRAHVIAPTLLVQQPDEASCCLMR